MLTWTKEINPSSYETVRWRMEEGQEFPYISVTSVLSLIVPDQLKKWFIETDAQTCRSISKKSAQKGTDIHQLLEDINLGLQVTPPQELSKIAMEYKNWLDDIKTNTKFKFIAIEKELLSKTYGVSGGIDAIVEINGKNEIWDYKSGRVTTMTGWQLGAYKLLAEENGIKIDGLKAIQINQKLNKIEIFQYEHFDFCILAFLKSLDIFKATYFNKLSKGIACPDGQVRKLPLDYLTFDSSYNYKKGIV